MTEDPRLPQAARALKEVLQRRVAGIPRSHEDDAREILAAADSVDPVRQHLTAIQALVDEQAEDEGLWGIHPSGQQPITEAYLQQELRRLHAVIEKKEGRSGRRND